MKKCRFCAEEIQDEAVKCRYCGEFLDESMRPRTKTKWYFSTGHILVSFLFIGPFALPFVWFHPRYKNTTKIIVTVIVGLITAFFIILLIKLVPKIWEYYSQLWELNKQL